MKRVMVFLYLGLLVVGCKEKVLSNAKEPGEEGEQYRSMEQLTRDWNLVRKKELTSEVLVFEGLPAKTKKMVKEAAWVVDGPKLAIRKEIKNVQLLGSLNNSKSELKKVSYDYYKNFWKAILLDWEVPDYEKENLKTIQGIIKNPAKGVKIKVVKENMAIIIRTGLGLTGLDLTPLEDLWIYKENNWQPVLGHDNQLYSVQLVNLNNDKLLDAVIVGGCCDSTTYNVFIGDKINVVNYTQQLSFTQPASGFFNDRCLENEIILSTYADLKKVILVFGFSCEEGKFVVKEYRP